MYILHDHLEILFVDLRYSTNHHQPFLRDERHRRDGIENVRENALPRVHHEKIFITVLLAECLPPT